MSWSARITAKTLFVRAEREDGACAYGSDAGQMSLKLNPDFFASSCKT